MMILQMMMTKTTDDILRDLVKAPRRWKRIENKDLLKQALMVPVEFDGTHIYARNGNVWLTFNMDRRPPFIEALTQGDFQDDIVKILCEWDEDWPFKLDDIADEFTKDTWLHLMASVKGSENSIRRYIGAHDDADVFMVNEKGKIPLDLVCDRGLRAFLKQHGWKKIKEKQEACAAKMKELEKELDVLKQMCAKHSQSVWNSLFRGWWCWFF